MSYYLRLVVELKNVKINKNEVFDLIKSYRLDVFYFDLLYKTTELRKVKRYLIESGIIIEKDISLALSQSNYTLSYLLSCLVEWYGDRNYIGNTESFLNPDIIIILGADSHENLFPRIEKSEKIIKDNPNSILVLSGGGFSLSESESRTMLTYVESYGITNEIILEEDSMDTIGNAFFSKLKLEKHALQHSKSKVLVITSAFHSLRSHRYFDLILGDRWKVATHGVRTIFNECEIKKRNVHELSTQKQAENILKFIENEKTNNNDLILKLFFEHDLYKNRYDLLRKFLSDSKTISLERC
ncbi:YdcF family protein [Photobacterium minamisatsumaniensis]|uniref:YdcF family protein n=1 Tax=Photobacterium minamisatsumaniensis TaxID=2910233 RepID=UPI003D0E0443